MKIMINFFLGNGMSMIFEMKIILNRMIDIFEISKIQMKELEPE